MSSIGKHTPGPWIYYADLPSTEPNWHIVTTASKLRVLANVHIEPGNAMDEANARLIAAAPDLLEALIAAKKVCDVAATMTSCRSDDDFVWSAQAKIDAAIAKATGGQ